MSQTEPNDSADGARRTEESRQVDVVVGRCRFVGKVTKVYDIEAVERTEEFIVQCLLQRMPVLSGADAPGASQARTVTRPYEEGVVALERQADA